MPRFLFALAQILAGTNRPDFVALVTRRSCSVGLSVRALLWRRIPSPEASGERLTLGIFGIAIAKAGKYDAPATCTDFHPNPGS